MTHFMKPLHDYRGFGSDYFWITKEVLQSAKTADGAYSTTNGEKASG